MMDQRTLNIINVCKGNTKYYGSYDDIDMLEGVKQYMADECLYRAEWYTERDILDIMYAAMLDYLDHCDKPSYFMKCLEGVMRGKMDSIAFDIAVTLSLVQVYNAIGYVNGFDDRIHALNKEELNDARSNR